MTLEGRRIQIKGIVQGVGFRPWVYRLAREEGIEGSVRNDAEGVVIEAFGDASALRLFLDRLQASPPPAARIRHLRSQPIPFEPLPSFRIAESGLAGLRRIAIPPDLATCDACAAEVLDPDDRRYRYPFTNCTSCGPRFTILRDLPYDRAATSMAGFAMCGDCRREYETPTDRRFHAEPNACPACGPALRAVSPLGEGVDGDPLGLAGDRLRSDGIVAVKGLGGYHLACDATSSLAVARLRRRKARGHKPFAVMVGDLAAAEALACMGTEERALLASTERPIVLLSRRPDAEIAPEVAPGSPLIGLLLAYTPLHHLLLAESGRPLVMTSGNIADEPIVRSDAEALHRLAGVADLFLVHDRPIEVRCDDSVARVTADRPVVLRRSRGYVPRGIPLARPFEQPVLACGGHFKNSFCIGVGDTAYLGPHMGDLESLDAARVFEEGVERMQWLLGVHPQVVAHDLHPGYLSTTYALSRGAPITIGVQHHHAHVASGMAEHLIEGPAVGIAYDGTGYGLDGALWGGEVLLCSYEGFERIAILRSIRLAGGEVAIRQVWRIALALLEDAFGSAAPLTEFPLFRGLPEKDVSAVRGLLTVAAVAPFAHGLGRYFDGLGALVLGRARSHYEGQVALDWNLAADPHERGRYAYELDRSRLPWSLDLRPMVRDVVEDLRAGASPGAISGRFHNTVAEATAEMARRTLERAGRLPVVLSGGCFQNALLTERVMEAMGPEIPVRCHGQVPPGDGGLALGQALVADAVARGRRRETECA